MIQTRNENSYDYQVKQAENALKNDNFDDIDEDYDFDEEEDDLQYKYQGYRLNRYFDWVCEHDHMFIADRVGLDLDACHDDRVNYTICL